MAWTPEQDALLRETAALGESGEVTRRRINEKFGTTYTRSAVIGRAKRLKPVVMFRGKSGVYLSRERGTPRLPTKEAQAWGRVAARRTNPLPPSSPAELQAMLQKALSDGKLTVVAPGHAINAERNLPFGPLRGRMF